MSEKYEVRERGMVRVRLRVGALYSIYNNDDSSGKSAIFR